MSFFSTRKFLCSTRCTSWTTFHNIPIEGSSVLRQQGHLTVHLRCTVKCSSCLRAELFLRLLGMLCNYSIWYNLYINLAFHSVCLFGSNKRQKRLNRSGPNFVWDLNWSQRKVYGQSDFKCVILKNFYL